MMKWSLKTVMLRYNVIVIIIVDDDDYDDLK